MNQYFASYLKYNGNPNIVPEDTAFLMPCIFMVQYCVATLGVKLSNKIGILYNIFIGLIIIYISIAIMIAFTNYYLLLTAMSIFGLGVGLETLSVINNCWKFFPNHTALVNGIIITGLGISSGILTPIGDYIIINPDKKEPIDGIYPEDVASNLKYYLYFLIILFVILGILAMSLTFNYEQESIEQKENNNILNSERESILIDNFENNNNKMGHLCEGFLSEKNFFLLMFCFCTPCKYINNINLLLYNYSFLLFNI